MDYELEHQRKAEVQAWCRDIIVRELTIKLVTTDTGTKRIALYLGQAPIGSVPYPEEKQ